MQSGLGLYYNYSKRWTEEHLSKLKLVESKSTVQFAKIDCSGEQAITEWPISDLSLLPVGLKGETS